MRDWRWHPTLPKLYIEVTFIRTKQFSDIFGTKMKLLILSACICLAWGAPPAGDHDAKIIKQELDMSPEGGYQWSFQADNGIEAGAQGEQRTIDAENTAQIVQGSATWRSPEGEEVKLTYIADENGYQPQGSHIPTSPPIPEAILRALEYIAAHPPKPDTTLLPYEAQA